MKRLLILLILAAILLSGCGTDNPEIVRNDGMWLQKLPARFSYTIIYVEGMPCMVSLTGLSCNWLLWEGE